MGRGRSRSDDDRAPPDTPVEPLVTFQNPSTKRSKSAVDVGAWALAVLYSKGRTLGYLSLPLWVIKRSSSKNTINSNQGPPKRKYATDTEVYKPECFAPPRTSKAKKLACKATRFYASRRNTTKPKSSCQTTMHLHLRPQESGREQKRRQRRRQIIKQAFICTLRTASIACARASSCACVRWLISMGITSARSRKSFRCRSEIHCAASLCKPLRSLKGVEAYT